MRVEKFSDRKAAQRQDKPCGGCTVEIKGLTVRDKDEYMIKNVSFSLRCGELLAVVGPNGGGKTTLVRSVLNLRAHEGTVEFYSAQGAKHAPRIGYVPQALEFDRLAPVTVGDFFASALSKRPVFFGPSRAMKKKTAELLKEVKADHLVDRPMGRLSGGELQRVLLALALTPVPELLLLDEPVSGMDANGLELFYSILDEVRSQHHLSIMLVSHDLRLVERHASRVAVIDKTLKLCGTPKEVFASKVFEQTFGLSMAGGDFI